MLIMHRLYSSAGIGCRIVVATLTLTAYSRGWAVDDGAPLPPTVVTVSHNRLMVQVEDVPLTALLQHIGQQAGFTVVLHGDFSSHTVSWSVQDTPLLAGLSHLINDHSFVVRRRQTAQGEVIVAVTVYAAAGSAASPPLSLTASNAASAKLTPANTTAVPARYARGHLDQGAKELDSVVNRIAAVERLIGLNGQDVIDRLEYAFVNDPSVPVRLAALTVLTDMHTPPVNVLARGLGDHDQNVRIAVLQHLEFEQAEEATLMLGQTIAGDGHADVRYAAVQALEGRTSDAATAFATAALQDHSAKVRAAAAAMLAQAQD